MQSMKHRESRYNKRGAALMLAIFIMTVTSALVVTMAETQMLRYTALRNARDWDSARFLAEAGLQHALSFLEDDIQWRAGLSATEFPIGSGQTYTASLAEGTEGSVLVTAVGSAGPFSRVLTAKIKQGG